MRVLFIGDIVGKPGRSAVRALLPKLSDRYKTDLVIANGENSAGGFGITKQVAEELFSLGIDVITGGNHIWDKKESFEYLSREERVLRPLNYPSGVVGNGSIIINKAKKKVAVISVEGRVFMHNLDCPFRKAEEEIKRLKTETNIIIIDFHGEATSEKASFAHFVDGSVSAVVGTHTHVQTADERILPKGTAFITDVGMTGPYDSVIGVEKAQVLERFLLQMPVRFEVAKGPSIFSAVVIDIDAESGRAEAIQRLMLNHP